MWLSPCAANGQEEGWKSGREEIAAFGVQFHPRAPVFGGGRNGEDTVAGSRSADGTLTVSGAANRARGIVHKPYGNDEQQVLKQPPQTRDLSRLTHFAHCLPFEKTRCRLGPPGEFSGDES